MNEPIDECDMCGADLYDGVPHECSVGGNVVIVSVPNNTKGDR